MIYVLMGKSATGKDTVYERVMQQGKLYGIKPVIPYTTRPLRKGEICDREYHFVNVEQMEQMEKAGQIAEHRVYNTVQGAWHYFTRDEEQYRDPQAVYLLISTLEGYEQLRDFYGEELVKGLYLTIPPMLRLERAISRERQQPAPNPRELCRRFLADEEDFGKEKLEAAGIREVFVNIELESCCEDLLRYLCKKHYDNE